MNIKEKELLSNYTTFRIGGPADFLIEAGNEEDIKEAILFAHKKVLPLTVIGGGSNILASDSGFHGVVLKMVSMGIEIRKDEANNRASFVVEAGEGWDKFVEYTVACGYFGMENMSLIPGTVGGAVVGNIGAYGKEIENSLLWVEAMDMRTGGIKKLSNKECDFRYRQSFFKTSTGRNFIILRACFELKYGGKNGELFEPNFSYKDLQEYFANKNINRPTIKQIREAVVNIRKNKLPDLAKCGTAGSFFKNPIISRAKYDALLIKYPDLTGHTEDNGSMKVSLGLILDKICHLKGVRRGKVGTYSEQALVLISE